MLEIRRHIAGQMGFAPVAPELAPICPDLADLDFVDVAGLRALRGTNGHPVTISSPSDAVRRLIALVGWDSDPAVELRFGYAV